ncbi:RNA methyltransferase [Sneathiella sp. P13V-1]|uniref:RNA methyltransferase n=1 Tax=Sneathiella sp. P13V-1 TaxID=2697366 RepID=UPI00187B12C8|nr:RNA methyltransferase [Sneathiella sp. P13V-1]MBE7637137.1 RNA methyltransferase [Sneathiella sp. P13V-1]
MSLDKNAPAVILVEPQMGENIGAAARAMLNFGLTDMRIVNPRDGWPNERAVALASRADMVLENARVFDTVAEATEDLTHVYATTARPRDMIKHVATPAGAAKAMREMTAKEERAGILFGKESFGLSSDDISYADTIITVPLNPDFSSINLAQAVLLVAYEWFQAEDETLDLVLRNEERPANKKEMVALFDRIESALDARDYFEPIQDRRPVILKNMRNMFQRFGLMESDIRAFHGIIKGLTADKKEK